MSSPDPVVNPSHSAEEDIYSLQAKITQLQSTIKALKKEGKTNADIVAESSKLNELRAILAEKIKEQTQNEVQFNRKAFDELILRKMYVVPSFEIHNGPAGLFDYGPLACGLKANMLALWRRHFVLEENMLEMECTNLTPSSVLETSGHVERFTDFMVKDEVTGDCFRADKLLEDAIDQFLAAHPELPPAEQEQHRVNQRQADAYDAEELHQMLNKYNVKSPTNNQNNLTKPFPFNLMFKTTIGPEGTHVGFLRPETAQGLFVNFRRLLDYNQQKMPFAAAQIGLGFRNEIAPRNGLLRVREFTMAEIEHFVNPQVKTHPRFKNVAGKELILFPSEDQLGSGRTIKMTIGEAVQKGIVNNETLGYFMARTQMWLEKIGVDPARMRFRQHLKTEMAHYAADCWDMEIKMSYGWIECVGHADRACFDLEQHSKRTGVPMLAAEKLAEAVSVERTVVEPNKKLIGPKFKGQQKAVIQAIEQLNEEEAANLKEALANNGSAIVGGEYEITSDLVSFTTEKKMVCEQKYTPSVIEPSYGIGRILYAVLEHSFSQRGNDEQRCVMSFKPAVAPIKVGIYRLINHAPFDPVVEEIRQVIQDQLNIAVRVDSSSGSVGRRYARADELGIPFGITVDFQSLLDHSVTVRDRDSMSQIRVPRRDLASLIAKLVNGEISWEQAMQRFVVVKVGDDEEGNEEGEETVAPKKSEVSTTKTTTAASETKTLSIEYTPRGSFSRPIFS
eukprot:gene10430-11347_t